jgi:WD40 repeat protein/tRNA A-37 threonylcarbamoyl transferase component Bud32
VDAVGGGNGRGPEESWEAETRLDQVIAEYLVALEEGRAPRREELIARHPDLAAELERFFADRDFLVRCKGEGMPAPKRAAEARSSLEDSGRQVVGDYELLEEIDRGGMGVVYKARQRSLGRHVALKMILAGRFASAKEVERFRLEAELAAKLDHPNIVPIYEVGEAEGHHFFAMKLIDGRNIAEEVARFAGKPREAAALVESVARAVHHAHQRGVLHRDLKPANILLDQGGKPYITDFGLAKLAGANHDFTMTSGLAGTPRYIAPELASGSGPLTVAADIYSLGVILFQLLAGVSLARSESGAGAEAVPHDEASWPPSSRRRVPADLRTITLKCLREDPHARYGSAEELAEELRRYRSGEPILARPLGLWARALRWVRRRPALAALAAAGVLFGLVLLVLAVTYTRKLEEKNSELVASNARERARALEAEERLRVQRHLNYSAQVLRAFKAEEEGKLQFVWETLGALRLREGDEELRGFEWYHLYRRACAFRDLKSSHPKGTHDIEFSSDGRFAILGVASESPRLLHYIEGRADWDWDTMPNCCSWELKDVAIAPSRDLIACASGSRDVRFCVAGVPPASWPPALVTSRNMDSVAFSPCGRLIAAGGDRGVELWEFEPRRQLEVFPSLEERVSAVAFSPDGNLLAAAAADGSVRIWALGEGEREPLRLHSGPVLDIAFSPDGRLLASASAGGSGALADLRSGAVLPLLGHTGAVNGIAFSSGGGLVATAGSDLAVGVWDASSGSLIDLLRGHSREVLDVVFTPDGRWLLSGGRDDYYLVWDAELLGTPDAFREPQRLGAHPLPVWVSRFSPRDGCFVTVSEDVLIKVWRVVDGLPPRAEQLAELRWESEGFAAGELSRDGALACAAGTDGTVEIWRFEWKEPPAIRRERLLTFTSGLKAINAVTFSPDTSMVSLASRERRIEVWALELASPAGARLLSEAKLDKETSGFRLDCQAFTPDGRYLIAGSRFSPVVTLIDPRSGARIADFEHQAGVTGAALLPSQELLITSGREGAVYVWDLASVGAPAENRHRLLRLKTDEPILSLALSPDGRRLVAGKEDGTITLWDLFRTAGEVRLLELGTLRRGRLPVTTLCFSEDGRLLLSAGGRIGKPPGEVHLWRGRE